MTGMGGTAGGLLAAGLLGVVLAAVYLRACEWADFGLMTSRARRRVYGCQRRAPALLAGSAGVAAVGLVLGVVQGLT